MAKKSKKCRDHVTTEAAITRHLAVLASSSVTLAAHTDESGGCDDAESDALKDVAESPCASDAEFIEKLRYLFAEEIRLNGGISSPMAAGVIEDSSVMLALATHFLRARIVFR